MLKIFIGQARYQKMGEMVKGTHLHWSKENDRLLVHIITSAIPFSLDLKSAQ